MKEYIFGYGSLINLTSLSKTLKRKVLPDEIIPVKLADYVRIWNLKENVFSKQLNRNIDAIFLNIERSIGAQTNGVIFEVSSEEFKLIKSREHNYDCIEVSNLISGYNRINLTNDKVYVFIATETNFLQNTSLDNTYVMSLYIKLIVMGCIQIGNYFYQDYMSQTKEHPFSILDGEYIFCNR